MLPTTILQTNKQTPLMRWKKIPANHVTSERELVQNSESQKSGNSPGLGWTRLGASCTVGLTLIGSVSPADSSTTHLRFQFSLQHSEKAGFCCLSHLGYNVSATGASANRVQIMCYIFQLVSCLPTCPILANTLTDIKEHVLLLRHFTNDRLS